MFINVASGNPVKVEAVRELVPDYPFLQGIEIHSVEVPTGVSDQPKSLEETLGGAINRARSAFTEGCKYSIGLESGLMQVPYTKTGEMDFCACAIYDGRESHVGLSGAFEFPTEITKLIKSEGINASDACHKMGLSEEKNIGYQEGIIGIVSDGLIDRKAYTKQAIQMALVQLQHPELYV
ncbi:inosine/xanthosine triphosphatase [Candidatus Pacearchaeota archaeon]|nr:inosine/xanthosine triphosphatase [Candidatus Pacearchaeota archaeon]|tara:strand:- start:438 stop:977 length:540 start_codon:yes stop_codon:yes gene_type:complete